MLCKTVTTHMRKTILLLIIAIIFTNCAKSQSELSFLANELCNSFEESDLKKSNKKLFKLIQNKSNEIYNKYPKKLDSLTEELKKKYPDKNQQEIALTVGNEISLFAIEKCPIFQKITQKIAVPEPNKNKKSITNVTDELCELLNNSSDKNTSALNKIVDDKLFDLVFQNKELIEKEYGNFGSSEYKTDLNANLMKNCDIYYKLIMGEN